jgi:alpha-1,2-mannosyltransferase
MYLPCGIDIANSIENDSPQQRENYIVSIGQFRPEKDYAKQIKSFAMFLSKQDQNIGIVKLMILIGSCRNDADYDRVKVLRELAFDKLKLPKSQVEFVINEKYSTLHKYMTKSLIWLHTMWNEHFGISVVEMMSNGLIAIGHNGGG